MDDGRWQVARGAASALVALALAACAGGAGGRQVLREYRVTAPKRQVIQPIWLASFTTDELYGRLSADGRHLLYAGSQKGNLDIWIKSLTTGVPRRMTDDVATDTQPCWAPGDGKKLRFAFVSMRQDVKGDIFLYDDGKLSALTDRGTADAFPVFSHDGATIYFASGPEGQSRIERISLSGGQRTVITSWGANHPAVSPDGQYLAYTQFDDEGRGRIAVMRLSDRSVRLITTPEYHAGFPAFSADGRQIYFSRFLSGAPGVPLTPDAFASLWRVDVRRALARGRAEEAMALAEPLTGGSATALFAQPTTHGVVFTTSRAGSLDIGMIPLAGLVPRLGTAREQLALALEQDGLRDQLLALQYVELLHPRTPETAQALFLSAQINADLLREYDKARALLRRLSDEGPTVHGDVAYLAQIDATTIGVKQQKHAERQGGPTVRLADVQAAQARMNALRLPPRPSARVAAHRLLRQGDLHRLADQTPQAIGAYEQLVRSYPAERAIGAEAKFRLGEVFGRLQEPAQLTSYYLTLFRDYPEQTDWLRRAADAVLALHSSAKGAEMSEVEALRPLIDRHRDKPLFCAIAQRRIGALYEQAQRLDLAIQAMAEVTQRYATLTKESTAAAFELGRLSLAYSDRLRQEGRLSEALRFYSGALTAYERIVRTYEPGHEYHSRARAEYLRLSLLEAGQLERDKELALAEKRYRRMLEFDPEMLQAHRKLIQLGVAQGRRKELVRQYEARLSKDAADDVALYSLGYLATFAEPLTDSALSEAEKRLQRAVDLNPQSPFAHMTLGWVYEMRERYLGQIGHGWLEEAILLYDRAYGLNDGRIDVQTEADLLVNLCSGFANLGNGWKQAYELCERRRQLKLSFLSPAQEATYHLTFGRAATATGHYAAAARELEDALELARDTRKIRLEAEAVVRLALASHLQGDHAASNRYYRQAMEDFASQGRHELLASLGRSLAHNLTLQGQHAEALRQIAEARRLLAKHGTPRLEKWQPSCRTKGKVWCTSAPFGFDVLDETHAALSLENMIHAARRSWPEIVPLLERRLKNRSEAFKRREDVELPREILVLQNRLALAQLQLGAPERFRKTIEDALASAEAQQTDKATGFAADKLLFPLQVALALSSAEQLLTTLASGAVDERALAVELRRLRRLEELDAAARKKSASLLPTRLQLALWTHLALVYFYSGMHAVEEAPPPGKRAAARPPRAGGSAADRALSQLLDRGRPMAEAVRLLRRVLKQTDPAEPAEEPGPAEREFEEKGVLAPLWRPLGAMERLRWHVLAGLNLAETSAALTPDKELERHPSTELLVRLAGLGVQHDLGALRFAVAAELAARRGSLQAMNAAVDGFLQRSPLLLEETGRTQAALVRQRIFRRAVALALRLKDVRAALAFAEQEERRAFVDELVALPPEGRDAAAAPVAKLLGAARAYRQLLARQDPALPVEKRKVWQEKLNAAEQGVQAALAALRQVAPRTAALFTVPGFPLEELQRALGPEDVALAALTHAHRVTIVAVRRSGAPTSVAVEGGGRGPALARVLGDLVRGARRAYVDLGRVDPTLRPEELLPRTDVVRLATLWELVDAHAVRNLSFKGGLVVDPRAERAAALAGELGFGQLAGAGLHLKSVGRPLEEAGVVVWSGPLRFDGGEATNARLLLHDPDGQRLGDLRLGRALGMPLRGCLLVLGEVRHTPGRVRAEQVALLRLAHAMGVPSLLVVDGPPAAAAGPTSAAAPAPAAAPPAIGPTVRRLVAALGQTDLAGALHRAGKGQVALFGHGGLDKLEATALAKQTLKQRVYAGAGAVNGRRLHEGIEHLETALRLMEFLGDDEFRDGTLLFLGNAYGFLEDFTRAVPKLEALLALRARAIVKARSKGKGVVEAQAKWVQALQTMAWLLMRNAQYVEALVANKQAIELYREVKRPLLAQPAYDQRSIIAEKKGDMKEALTYAQRALETAKRALALAPKSAVARAVVASAAIRMARLQRMRFSDYRQALAAAQLALAHIPVVKPEQLRQTTADYISAQAEAKGAKGKALAAVNARLAALGAQRRAQVSAIEERIVALLEIARIYSARGDYNRAVDQAQDALELAKSSALPLQDAPLLEVVNNLYYVGVYGRALQAADEGLRQAKKNEVRQIQFYNAKGSIYAALGQTREALVELQQALRIATRLRNPVETAASHNNLGDALRRAGRFAEAKQQFSLSLAIDRRQEDKLGMAFDYANLGLTEELAGKAREARRRLEQALELSRQIGAPLNELKALAGLGRLDLVAGQAQGALGRFRAGQAIAVRLGLRSWSWRFHLLAGRALRRVRQIAAARAELTQGLTLVEELPPRQRKALGTPQVEEEPEDLYDELVDLLAVAGEATAALELAERLRARSFVDLVGQGALRLPHKEAGPLLSRLAALQLEQEAARGARGSARTREDRTAAEAELARVGKELRTAQNALVALNPQLPSLVGIDVWPMSRLRPLLPAAGTRILCYYPTRERLVIWVMQGGAAPELRIVPVTRRALTDAVSRFRESIARFHRVEDLARQLHGWLLEPALRGSRAVDRLVIIPGGPLHILPFAALHDGKDYAVARHTIQYLPSLNALRFFRDSGPEPGKHPVSFGWAGTGRRPLGFAGREAEALGATFPGALVAQGSKATRARFLAEASSASLLHIASHAVFREEAPLASTIELADGPLPLIEVLALKLDASLAVLSACDTGLGQLDGADGLLGLQRAFLAAGARRVVAALFRVSDLGTALLMKHFFRALTHQPPAAALRAAQNTLRRRFSHPAFWAGFRLDGAL